jgi:FKBP-type peptidyl-prolyl cis-trans isomerase (trigger factor)
MLALVAAVLLSSCGGFAAPAAEVNGQRITEEQLQQELDLRVKQPQVAAQLKGPQAETATKDYTRQLLTFLIERALLRAYAAAHRITVTPADVDQQIQQSITQLGGQQEFAKALKDNKLTLQEFRQEVTDNVLIGKVETHVLAAQGVASSATADQRSQAFTQWLHGQLLRAHIDVNPRFGRLDIANERIVPITSTAQ